MKRYLRSHLPKEAYETKPTIDDVQRAFSSGLKWQNLKGNRCPKCDSGWFTGLIKKINSSGEVILVHRCDFKIRETKYNEIMKKLENE